MRRAATRALLGAILLTLVAAPPLALAAPPDDAELPPGHPPRGEGSHMELPKKNTVEPDPSLPRGTLAVDVRSPDGAPVAHQEIVLGVVRNTVAEGESRRRLTATTDSAGTATFGGLEADSAFAYRVSTMAEGAQLAAAPFNLPDAAGMRVTLYVYPVVRDIDQAGIAVQAGLFLELRDDLIVVEQAYRIFNLGKRTWLSQGTPITLPAGHKAFNAPRGMSDLIWDATKDGAKLTGTVAPGSYETSFRFHLPTPDDPSATIDLGVLPHVQAFRVMSSAPRGMTLEVDGFPPAVVTDNGEGQRVLFTERTMDHLDRGFLRLRIRLDGIPDRQHRSARNVAVAVSLAILLAGLYAAWTLSRAPRRRDPEEDRRARDTLLDALVELERAHAAGEIGPKTHAAEKRRLLDALAHLVAEARPVDNPVESPGSPAGQPSDRTPAG